MIMRRLPMPPKKATTYEIADYLSIWTDSLGVPSFVQVAFNTDFGDANKFGIELSDKDRKTILEFLDVPVFVGDFEKAKGHANKRIQLWRAALYFGDTEALILKQRIASAYLKKAASDLSSPKTTMQAKEPLMEALEALHLKIDSVGTKTGTIKPRK